MRANRVWQLSHPYSGQTSRHAKFIDSTVMVPVVFGVGGGVGGVAASVQSEGSLVMLSCGVFWIQCSSQGPPLYMGELGLIIGARLSDEAVHHLRIVVCCSSIGGPSLKV